MATTALITGASSGLGSDYARQLAERGADLVLVARDRDALQTLAEEIRIDHGVTVTLLVADLLNPKQRDKVCARLSDPLSPVGVLVNAAGFGLPLTFEHNALADEVNHLELLVQVPMMLMHAVLPGMLARGRGRILNIASVAAFTPRSTYGAAKRWLVSFSEWANATYGPQGVTVTAVCPGFTHTNFHERMGLAPGNEGVPTGMWLDSPDVVAQSLRDAARGKAVSIPSFRYKALVLLVRLLPSAWAARVAGAGR